MSIARKSAFDATAQIATVAISMIAGIFVSRNLGGDGRGLYVLATVIANTMLISFGSFGLFNVNQVFAARDRHRFNEIHSFTCLYSLTVGCIGGALILLFAAFFQRVVFRDIPFFYLVLVAASFPFAIYHRAWRGMMNGLGAVRRRAGFDFVYGITQSISIIGILVFIKGEPITTLVITYYAILVGGAAVMVILISGVDKLWAKPRWDLIRQIIGYGKWVYLGNVPARLRTQLDQVLVNYTGSNAALGVYNQAVSLAQKGFLPAEALVAASYKAVSTSDKKEAGRLVASGFRQLLLIGIVITAGGWLIAPLIPIIYGPDFVESVWIFRMIVPVICLTAATRILVSYFSGTLVKPQIPMMVNWIVIAYQFGASILLAIKYGPLTGITFGTASSFLLASFLFVGLFALQKETPPAYELIRFRREDFNLWKKLIPGRKKKA